MKVDKAKISDVQKIHELINDYAEKGHMLPRALREIYQGLRDYMVIRDEKSKAIGCVALCINWEDMAEIRSLAVDPKKQFQGLGGILVKACLDEAKTLGIPMVFCLTNKQQFFEKQGFHLVDKTQLPRKVWAECYNCPKFPDCDEVSMICKLVPDEKHPGKGTVHTISSQQIYDGRAIKVRVDTVLTPSGRKTTREIVEHVDAIVAVPIDENNDVVMIKQYREAVGRELLELPAGGIDDGEQPVDTVKRELQEEIGYLPGKVEKIGGFYPAPGYNTEYLHLYLASELTPSRLVAEDTEEIKVVRVPVSKIHKLIDSGEICDAKSIIGLMKFLELNKKKS
jgi:amino-acid N-acetyltransferase